MTYTAVKEKLHNYIENADQKKIKAIYALLENEMQQATFIYDEVTLSALEKRSDEAFAGRSKTMTVKQSMDKIKLQRVKNGL